MQPLDGNASSIEPIAGARSPEAELLSTLAVRVDALESLLRTTKEVVDEKTLKELRRTIESLAKRDPKFEERVTNKVDVVADRVESLAKTVSTSSSGLVAKEGEIVQLRRELAAGLARVDAAAGQHGRGVDAAELAEIKRALGDLAQLTKQKLPRGLEGRVDELAGKLTLLGQRVDSISTTISTTAAGLAGRDGDVAALRRMVETDQGRLAGELAELRRVADPRLVDDLREALKAQADETARRLHSTRQVVSQTGATVDALTARIAELTASVSSTTERASATEAGLAAFRKYFEDAGGRLSAHIAEHQRSLAALSARAAALQQADEEAARAVEVQVASVAGKVDGLADGLDAIADRLTESGSRISGHEEGMAALRADVDEVARLLEQRSAASDRVDELGRRLDQLSPAVAATSERLDARDAELQVLERRFHDASSRVDGLVAELSRALAELPDPGARLDEQADELASVADRVARAEAALSEQLRRSAAAVELEQQLSETRDTASDLSLRVDALTTSLTALAERAAALEHADEDAARTLDEQVGKVTGEVDGLAGRIESLADTLSATASTITGSGEEVSALREYVEGAGKRLTSLVAEHTQSLAALGERAAALERSGDEVAGLSQRLDSLAETVTSAASSLGEKEHELSSLHRHFTESSTRIESVVDDIRAALSALPDVGSVTTDDLAAYVERLSTDMSSLGDRLDRLESTMRDATDGREHRVGEIAGRLDLIDRRVGAVAAEVARAKTLWPVALRSLEARLDDAVSHARAPLESDGTGTPTAPDETPDELLLAGLRDGLQAMETVAAEMARASDALGVSVDGGGAETTEVAATGATVVPLRATEP